VGIIALITSSATFFLSTVALFSVILFCKAKDTSNGLEMTEFPPGPNPLDASDWDSVQEPEQEQA
jgi:hypothetical protein